MRHTVSTLILLVAFPPLLPAADPPKAPTQFTFRDVGAEVGLYPHIAGIAGHAAAWGDIDGSGYPSLYVGTFGGHPYGSKTNRLFRNVKGKFLLDEQAALRVEGRASGALFADLDNTGRLDLFLSNHAIDAKEYKQPHYGTPSFLFQNLGGGKFKDVSAASGTCPPDIRGRSVAALDFDGSGKLGLLVGECFLQGGKGRTRLYRNLGGMKFADVTKEVGLPEDMNTGMGVAVGDVNGDGWPDIFVAGRNGNRLYINDGKGKFREVPKTHANFDWKFAGTPDNTTCGVCFADLSRSGRLDIIIGQHFDYPWTEGVPIRLYLNRGNRDGFPVFEDVTEKVGLKPLPMKAPHIEVQDFDNDGWPDIYVSIVKFAGGKPHPLIFKNLGVKDGLPRFHEDVLALNDFPTAEDRKMTDVGRFFEKMNKERKVMYMAAGPSADFDRDGRIDLFMANWWVSERSLLLRNETKSGNWLDVTVNGAKGINRMGIGCKVRVYPAGKLGQEKELWGHIEISAGYGYSSGQEAVAHFGLGEMKECDVEVILPFGKGRFERKGVNANWRVNIAE